MRFAWRLGCAAALAFCLILLSQSRASADDNVASPLAALDIQRDRLDNGLRVVTSVDHSLPIVAIAVYYNVGSRNEKKGRDGFAHLFEHMMFQGSANVAKGEHFRLIMNRGGSMNGTTSEDRTNYFETLPASELALGLWLEADRMRSLAITEENFENQRQTVMEERRQSYDNEPYAPSMLRINELAYDDYWPYAHSTIGDMQALLKAPLSAVRDFFNDYYAPNNAVLAIVGDIDRDQALALAKKYFASISARKVPSYDPPAIKAQTKERRESMSDANASLYGLHMAYHIPPSREPDHYALELLAGALSDGESSILYRKLVKEKELCLEIHAGTDDRRGPDLFSFWTLMATGKDSSEVEKIINDELASVAKNGLSARDLEKAKNRIRSHVLFGLQTPMGRAMQLAEFETYWNDATLLRSELDKYLGVSNDDIRRAASTYFQPSNRSVLLVQPSNPDSK